MAVAANLVRLAEQLAKDQTELASTSPLAGDFDRMEGKAAITEVVAATAKLVNTLRESHQAGNEAKRL